MRPIQLVAFVILAAAPLAFAQEGVQDKIRDLEKRAEAAQAEGRAEEAQKIRKALDEIAARQKEEGAKREAGRSEKLRDEDVKADLEKTRREFEDAARSGRGDAAEKLKQRISELEARYGKMKHSEESRKVASYKKAERSQMDEAHQKLQHLGEAIEHLRAAGLNEPAASLTEQAHAMKRQLAEKGGRGGEAPQLDRQLAEMREGMMNLQRQVQEIQKRLEELSRERR